MADEKSYKDKIEELLESGRELRRELRVKSPNIKNMNQRKGIKGQVSKYQKHESKIFRSHRPKNRPSALRHTLIWIPQIGENIL